jgi:aspartyl-tRNA synthetase
MSGTLSQRVLTKDVGLHVGETILVEGWINSRRDHGNIVFLDIRDRSGKLQMIGTKEIGNIKTEDCVSIKGLVKNRPGSMVNAKIATGAFELEIQELTVLSKAETLPFPIDTDGYEIEEETRTKYRYLDIRRPRMARNLRLRSAVVNHIRNYQTHRFLVEI